MRYLFLLNPAAGKQDCTVQLIPQIRAAADRAGWSAVSYTHLEQAASCQRVLGAGANIVNEYATKRYRSNLINWGMLPFQLNGAAPFGLGDYILIPHVREALKGDLQNIPAYVLGEEVKPFALYMAPLTSDEREILADGCLINYYKH